MLSPLRHRAAWAHLPLRRTSKATAQTRCGPPTHSWRDSWPGRRATGGELHAGAASETFSGGSISDFDAISPLPHYKEHRRISFCLMNGSLRSNVSVILLAASPIANHISLFALEEWRVFICTSGSLEHDGLFIAFEQNNDSSE